MAPNDAYCELVDIDFDIDRARRAADELTSLHRNLDAPLDSDSVAWCAQVARDDYWACVRDAAADHDECRDEADYNTCRRRASGELVDD